MTADGFVPTRTVPTGAVIANRDLWPRTGIDHERVAAFAALLRDDGPSALPPIDVVTDGNQLLLADGWHRLTALRALRAAEVAVRVIDAGGLAPAAACYQHGLLTAATAAKPLSRAERTAAVRRLLAGSPQLADREIARLTGTSPSTVGAHRRRLATPDAGPTDADGPDIESRYLAVVSADELASRLAHSLAGLYDARGMSDRLLGDRTGRRLAAALRDVHGPNDALSWAVRLAAWTQTAVNELGG